MTIAQNQQQVSDARLRQLHADSVVIDGLIFCSDGNADILLAGGITAANVTVTGLQAGFMESVDQLAAWHRRLAQPDSPWLHVRTVDDILTAKKTGRLGLIMGSQSMDMIGKNLDRIRLLHAAGMRVMQPTYNEGNLLADGCLEPRDAGLTDLGRDAVREMNRVGVAIDLSHLGERACLQIVEITERPVLLTHANAKSVVNVPRNKSDHVIQAVAGTGGLIGISVYGPMCWSGDPSKAPSLSDFLRHLNHVVDLVGIERVSLGTDFPGLTDLDQARDIIAMTLARYPGNVSRYAAAFGNDVRTRYLSDCSAAAQIPAITDALGRQGWSDDHITRFLGRNYLEVLRKIWTEEAAK